LILKGTWGKCTCSVPEVVDEAVPKVVNEAVPKVVNEAAPKVVNEALPKVVNEALPKVVNEAVPKVVDEALHGFGGQGHGDRRSTAVGLGRRRGGSLPGSGLS
jgi:hypothetical protein